VRARGTSKGKDSFDFPVVSFLVQTYTSQNLVYQKKIGNKMPKNMKQKKKSSLFLMVYLLNIRIPSILENRYDIR